MRLDRNCVDVVVGVYLIFTLLDFVFIAFVRIPWVVYPFVGASVWFCVWQTYFHTVPVRERSGNSKEISSVADGRVLIIEKVFEGEFLKRDCLQLSVYMNFFDVHANFWPLNGEVVHCAHIQGAHLFADHPKASLENEHTVVVIKNEDGQELMFKQIAGGFARRIVCNARKGERVSAGTQCGIIKFGSRIDMFLPLDTEIRVKVGDLVRASETVLAKLS